jgi:hypothetical protein
MGDVLSYLDSMDRQYFGQVRPRWEKGTGGNYYHLTYITTFCSKP